MARAAALRDRFTGTPTGGAGGFGTVCPAGGHSVNVLAPLRAAANGPAMTLLAGIEPPKKSVVTSAAMLSLARGMVPTRAFVTGVSPVMPVALRLKLSCIEVLVAVYCTLEMTPVKLPSFTWVLPVALSGSVEPWTRLLYQKSFCGEVSAVDSFIVPGWK